ncbi:hypothetical protein EST62_09910 [Chlorobaculum sp. 24CR]|uniref:intermembrane phospholipid transport protein YdbH family protein n=1 Tax=Chlorobaculum sp. 24CR TaxID=2508878 RepID=UPI00100C3153|nr:YdbH domain-containing protein [Chlorobaculum sp. 24CR]RXK84355.1 hypothetical protein EST62_09910 [Chlorobaculum sp. 24CR]
MKWLARIIGTLLLLAALAVFGAWLAFPWYAQTLIDRATAGKGIAVKLHSPGRPGLSSIGFDQLDATIHVKPDSCSTTPSTYTLTLQHGRLTWRRIAGSATPALALRLDADAVSGRQMPSEIRFRQANPSLRARLDFRKAEGLLPSVAPDSIAVAIRRGQAEVGQLRLDEISYDLLLTRSRDWVQQPARFSARSLFSGSARTPLSNFEATFGLQRDPRKPCTLKFSDCSVELFGLRATTPEVEYSLRNKRTAFVLKLDNLPLDRFSSNTTTTALTGEVSGSVPVEYLGSTIRVSDGIVDAAKGAAITFGTGKTKLSFDAGRRPGGPPLIGGLNAKVTLDATSGAVSAIRLDSLSARLFGGRIESTPARYDLESGKAATTIKIDNAPILDRIRLLGDFSGAMNGRISGAIPIRLSRDGIAISNARLTAQGGGTIRQKLPRQAASDADALFPKSASSEVLWKFGDPVVTLNREAAGRLKIDAALKSIERTTGGGELLLTSPKGALTMFARPGKPSLLTLSGFSAGLLGGSVSVERMEYNLDTKRAKTVVQLDGIPIQSLLDLQGASKLSATGTIRAAIPVVLDNGAFSIPDGSMDAEKNGLIVYSSTPEERAAAGAGLRLTYEALGNFFYSELVSTITMTPDGDSRISIQLKGRNPEFQNNRPVNLNLNIEQNLLDLFRSLTLSSDIEQAISEKVLEKSGGKKGEK